MKLDWGNWLYGLVNGFIGGGAGAIVSGVTASMLVPDKLAIGSGKFFILIGTVFLTHGSISAAMYLQQNPVPKKVTVDEASMKSVSVDDAGKTTATETAVKTVTTVTEKQ